MRPVGRAKVANGPEFDRNDGSYARSGKSRRFLRTLRYAFVKRHVARSGDTARKSACATSGLRYRGDSGAVFGGVRFAPDVITDSMELIRSALGTVPIFSQPCMRAARFGVTQGYRIQRLGAAILLASSAAAASDLPSPWVERIEPLGALRGSTIGVELTGRYLSNAVSVEFDCDDIEWLETLETGSGGVRGRLRVSEGAALGPHIFTVITLDGRSNARLFNVTQFPSTPEVEPNDLLRNAQRLTLKPQIVNGLLPKGPDIDTYVFEADAGERWNFDLRSIEFGSHLECEMALLDAAGREVAFNDDRDDYLETPYLDHTFQQAGAYYLKLDQYRGPQGVNCAQNCGYMLRITKLPLILGASPLGARIGSEARVTIHGERLDSVRKVYLTQVRSAEYYRLTFPFSIPVHVEADPVRGSLIPRIRGRIISRTATRVEAHFPIPADARPGLWRLWLESPDGTTDGMSLELTDEPELAETAFRPLKTARRIDGSSGPLTINGLLELDQEEDSYIVLAKAGVPLRFRTLAVQLGLPYIDTVLELFDSQGKLIAEHDDMMTGQGTVIGNPDSSLIYTPQKDEALRLVVRDRIGRGGRTYAYRLKIDNQEAGFQLLVDPDNINVARGERAQWKVLMIRDPGFDGAVDVEVTGLPEGVEAPAGKFRADQFFGPSGDGDNVIIPELPLETYVPTDLPPGDYPIRILGRVAGVGDQAKVVEAFSTLWIGAPRKRNDIRRPVARAALTVVEPFGPRLRADPALLSRFGGIQLHGGGSALVELKAEGLPADARIRLVGAPPGLTFDVVERKDDSVQLELRVSKESGPTEGRVSVEAEIGGRWAMTAPIRVTVTGNPNIGSR